MSATSPALDETVAPLASLVRARRTGSGQRIVLPNGTASGSVIPLIDRRAFISSLAGSLLAAPLDAGAQQAVSMYRLGMLGGNPIAPALYETFKQGLGQVGFTERQVVIVQVDAAGVPSRMPARAADLIRDKVDVIFARGPVALAAAVAASKTIPIVAIDLESDPIALGYAKTLARPGGNVTGVFLDLPELSAKQLQVFREILPGLSRVALVGDSIGNAAQFRVTERAAGTLAIKVQTFEGRTAAELDVAMEVARRNGAGAVIISRHRSSSTIERASPSSGARSGCRRCRCSPNSQRPAAC